MKNWKTTATGIGATIMWAGTMLAAAPHDARAQMIGDLLPEPWRIFALNVCLAAAAILQSGNALAQADAKPQEEK